MPQSCSQTNSGRPSPLTSQTYTSGPPYPSRSSSRTRVRSIITLVSERALEQRVASLLDRLCDLLGRLAVAQRGDLLVQDLRQRLLLHGERVRPGMVAKLRETLGVERWECPQVLGGIGGGLAVRLRDSGSRLLQRILRVGVEG